ncbi:MAG: hypothetical protein U0174_02585 [Polyangiaceae bacterium]
MAISMKPESAGKVLVRFLKPEPLTIADAAAQSGLALRDAEAGLHWLSREYRGRLRVGEKGDLVFFFPTGFAKPWEKEERTSQLMRRVGHGALGVARFVVRAWVMLVLVFYGLLFLALAIAFAARSNDDRGGGVSGALFGGFIRLLADALFWTFHPFSPFYVDAAVYTARNRQEEQRRMQARFAREGAPYLPGVPPEEEPEVPFYEKVNRFLFGPTPTPVDEGEVKRRIVQEIRAHRGRVGLADVMRVTGLPRATVDPLMAELMLDFEGNVEVSEKGGIYYTFEAIRRTAREGETHAAAPPAWDKPKALPPLTGNSGAANVLIGLLNGFNLLMSAWVMAKGFTLTNLFILFTAKRGHPPVFVNDGLPLALGLVPFVFSLGLFLLPVLRAVFRAQASAQVAAENGRLAIVRTVLEALRAKRPVTNADLAKAYKASTGTDLDDKTLALRVAELGGDVDLDRTTEDGRAHYRFVDLELEQEAVEEERAKASEDERRVGRIVFKA